jgi:anthranilate synthase component I
MIVRELTTTVSLAAIQHQYPEQFPLLLQSVAGGNALSRWDMLLWHSGEGLCANADGQVNDLTGINVSNDFLAALDAEFLKHKKDSIDTELPFKGGWALFFAYELAAQIEIKLKLKQDDQRRPLALALRCPAALLFDRLNQKLVAVAETQAALDSVLNLLSQSKSVDFQTWVSPSHIEESDPQQFIDGVLRVKEYLAAGDVFQVNLSRGWTAIFDQAPSPSVLYQRLCESNPAPFAGLLRWKDWAMISSSPERLVSVNQDTVQTRPIAGTRPRFAGDDDAQRIQELIGHPKERAEHIMLIDLERNDLGRVCTPGSVRVDELMIVETYAHVHHIVSNVRGELRADVTPGEVIRAVFPGGTITGCPKVRCMEIIAELEQTARGAYTGAVGYLNRDGDMDLNILIRSLWTQGNEVHWRAGAGLVMDSDPQHELDETRAKARGLLRALGAD